MGTSVNDAAAPDRDCEGMNATHAVDATAVTPRTKAPRIALLGTGIMGSALGSNLLAAGFEVQVWNRTPVKAKPLVDDGARATTSPAQAAAGVDVLVTMLSDGPAVNAVMTDPQGALRTLKPGAVWVQMSTVGVDWCDHLAQLAALYSVSFVDAPVSGSPQAARDRQLVILASGARAHRALLEPIFNAMGRRTIWPKRAGDGSRLKLALNNWLAILVEGMAESLTLSVALGLDPHLVLDAIDGGALASRYATDKANAMMHADFAPGFPLRHAVKDATLAFEAARDRGVRLPLTSALLARWHRAIANGHGGDDVASAITASTRGMAVAASSNRHGATGA
jgi:3-hydroxyisobutyrate dehydrogenase